jgi:NAD(P)-dependent dehydrogenase (short-subunit alcohol dehydrogenase family)
MTTALYILTGSSRGLGAAIAEQLLAPGVSVLGIARGTHTGLAAAADTAGASVVQWQADLGDPLPLAQRLETWLAGIDAGHFDRASLINNAGVISRIGPVDAGPRDELSLALRVGLEAPLLLSAAFLKATAGWRAERRILNISSGLGRRAMAGSASYCAAKAGLDHLTRAMALDEAQRPGGARIVSLAPGVIDTDMQLQLRSAAPQGFPDQSRFLALHAQQQLSSAADAARQVIGHLHRADFGQETIADVRQG